MFFPSLVSVWRRVALLGLLGLVFVPAEVRADPIAVPRYARHAVVLTATGTYANPYVELEAEALLIEPDGVTQRRLPLYWDGGATWRFQFTPDKTGLWQWSVRSADSGLNGQGGSFTCVPSDRRGSIGPMAGATHHFQYQNGERMWFLGDTAWSYGLDNAEEQLDRTSAERYATNRAQQGFNAIHLMLQSEVGWGNSGGKPWIELKSEQINPAYFRELEARIAFANAHGLVTGLAIGWGLKGRDEPYAWGRFPSQAARERYARAMAARFSAYDVYFLVSGEWDTEIRWRPAPEEQVRREFDGIGAVLRAADPHHRMIGIHPSMRQAGSVREFNPGSPWMDFADYQQDYNELHAAILKSRAVAKPAVNGEYAYWLRDANGDGVVDKAHSYSLADIRGATWDITMAGGYVVAGFGSTYLGGARHRTTFLPDDPANGPWIEQLGLVRQFFTALDYWQLTPHDELLASTVARSADRSSKVEVNEVQVTNVRAPATTYWCLANPGKTYVVYARGLTAPVTLQLPSSGSGAWQVEQFDPRTGARQSLAPPAVGATSFEIHPPDAQDWLVVVRAPASAQP